MVLGHLGSTSDSRRAVARFKTIVTHLSTEAGTRNAPVISLRPRVGAAPLPAGAGVARATGRVAAAADTEAAPAPAPPAAEPRGLDAPAAAVPDARPQHSPRAAPVGAFGAFPALAGGGSAGGAQEGAETGAVAGECCAECAPSRLSTQTFRRPAAVRDAHFRNALGSKHHAVCGAPPAAPEARLSCLRTRAEGAGPGPAGRREGTMPRQSQRPSRSTTRLAGAWGAPCGAVWSACQ